MSFLLRSATPEDSFDVAKLLDLAVEGMPMAFWTAQMVAGEDAMQIGINRCSKDDTATSYRRAKIAELDGEIVGLIFSYDKADLPAQMDSSVHPLFRPMMKLLNTTNGIASINTMAVYPKYQRRGIGSALLNELEASDRGSKGQQALLMTDVNQTGHAFSEERNYRVVGEAPVIKGPWDTQAATWQLRGKLHS